MTEQGYSMPIDNKGFWAICRCKTEGVLMPNEKYYLKELCRNFRGSSIYGVLDPKTGKKFAEVTSRELNNRFEVVG